MMETPRTTYVRRPRSGWLDLALDELWAYRDLLFTLMWRNLTVRYKQSVIGIAWAVLKPVIQMLVFSVVFGRLANLPSDGVPYPIFLFAGLLPWTYFTTTVTSATGSLLAGSTMISKVYFPRMILPFSYLLTGLIDLALSMAVLFGMMVWYRADMVFGLPILLFPVFLLPAIVFAGGCGLWLSAMAVRYRDIHHLVPYLLQLGLFVTPVVYAVTLLPDNYQWILQLNPMTGVVEGFRWSLLGKHVTGWGWMSLGFGIALLVLLTGMIFFRRVERTVADVI
ncbi:MAG: ABC transporter permease [Lentisphaerae bacterium]|jgi:lipopolysaccharide transport system permease protein|nr:ABC transporter permease [Lentisphaerota bacterium]NLL02660.1 ABC transporter permease [Mollicutes bacterium]